MLNVNFKDNIIHKYIFSTIIRSFFFCIIASSNWFIFALSFLNNLTNIQVLNV
jgi:hypothetical protein